MKIYNFVVLSVILLLAIFSLLALAKPICLSVHLMYMNSNRIDAEKSSQGKRESPQQPNSPQKNLKIY